MTDTTTPAEREAFEAWWDTARARHAYTNESAWAAWQARAASQGAGMSKREDRSIRASLERHAWLMAKYMAQGMNREDASKHAFKELTNTAKAAQSALAKVPA